MYHKIIARYGEIAVKKKNRASFEKQLLVNMRHALQGLEPVAVYRTGGRIVVEVPDGGGATLLNAAMDRLRRVFGIVSLSPVAEAPLDLEAIQRTAEMELRRALPAGGTFKVETRRSNKQFPYASPEISRLVGGYLLSRVEGTAVDVHQPDATVYIEVREDACYVYGRIIAGLGGLPVGVSGRVMLLLSGGIDSPVAGWLAMKRGGELEAVHFHSFPFTSDRSKQKVFDLAKVLAEYGGRVTVHVVHFTEVQKAIRQHCPEPLGITVMRRFMLRIAERLAMSRKALALVTGESLGQVASQTLESMRAINAVTAFPVLRPLIGADKMEIIRLSRTIGTYDISILPYEDCCTIFVPASPRTKPSLEEVERAEQPLDVESLVAGALERIETVTFRPDLS